MIDEHGIIAIFPYKAPFSYEKMKEGFRIRDADDHAVCRCATEDNAKVISYSLNLFVAIAKANKCSVR